MSISMGINEERLTVTDTSPSVGAETQHISWYKRMYLPLWLCLLIALALRVWFIVYTQSKFLIALHTALLLLGTFCIFATIVLVIISFFWNHAMLIRKHSIILQPDSIVV
jgi:hypothetical protein